MDDRFSHLNKLLQKEMAAQTRKARKKWPRLIFIFTSIFLLFFILVLAGGRSSLSQGKALVKKTGGDLKAVVASASATLLPSFSFDEQKNILFLGVPGKGNDAPNLTDTIILAQILPDPPRARLISIPRDLFVKIPDTEQYAKINSLYSSGKAYKNEKYGLSLISQKIEQITGQKIDHYFLVDLSVVKQIIDELDGINLIVQKDIVDNQFPGPNHSFQTFEIKAGWRYLDGETALKYIRSRHSLNGDFDRIARQQQVLEAIKQKLMGLNPVFDLPPLIRVADKLYNNIKTDIPLSQLPQFWQVAKQISPDDISNIIIDKNENNLLISEHVIFSDGEGYVLRPKAGLENFKEIKKFIEENK